MKILGALLGAVFLMLASPAFSAGAIAVDHQRGDAIGDIGYGIGWGRNYDEAKRDAIRECRSAGNSNCRAVVWFETCGAYAASRTQFASGWGRTEERARRLALEKCPNCRIVVSECE